MRTMKFRITLVLTAIALGAGALVARAALPAPTAPPPTPASKDPAQVYRAECAACHLAYPPGLLPAASWRRLLGGLDDHFGQHAELDLPTRTLLEGWLAQHAADSGHSKRGRKILRSLGDEAPLRISQTPYILRKHDELRPSVFARPSVGSLANCTACHEGAERGDFEEDRVRIPK